MKQTITYPPTRKDNQKDNYFGAIVRAPYRWLEDDNSEETKAWVKQQNKVTEKYLSSIPFRNKIRKELTEIWNYPKMGAPFKRGDYYYFYKNDGLQNQDVLYRLKDFGDEPEVFLDPNKMSADGTAAISVPVFSEDCELAAYLKAQAGSDWQVAKIIRVADRKLLDDEISFIKFSGIAWDGKHGFYYSRYPAPDETKQLTNQNINHAVYYHKTDTSQSDDTLVYEDHAHPYRTIYCGITEDKRFLLINKSEGTSGTELWIKDLTKPNSSFINIIRGFDTESSFVDNAGDRILVLTNESAANYCLVSIDPAKTGRVNWQTVIPENDHLLQAVGTAGGKLFATYLQDVSHKVYQFDYNGENKKEIELPGIGTTEGFYNRKDQQEIFYTFNSFNYPPAVFRYNISTQGNSLFHKSEIKLNAGEFETRQLFFTSKDGTKVPLFITYNKGMKQDGNNPLLLYGYGGFDIPVTPVFPTTYAYFVSKGGIHAVVNLRGGNEYGEKWHRDGMLMNKQHVFDDMIAAAEFLIKEGYSNPQKMAIRGRSNGGLLVGAVMTQRPDLFKVAIPQVGVMDMLRYHKFTIGWAWATEYGRSDDNKESFENLYHYSPLHRLKKGVPYPATLVTTADHDDRVVPAHSFKFAATLQEVSDGNEPALIRIDSKAGHGLGKPTAKLIEEEADIWTFVMYNLGMEV